jgi:hypothetical protein
MSDLYHVANSNLRAVVDATDTYLLGIREATVIRQRHICSIKRMIVCRGSGGVRLSHGRLFGNDCVGANIPSRSIVRRDRQKLMPNSGSIKNARKHTVSHAYQARELKTVMRPSCLSVLLSNNSSKLRGPWSK